MNEKESIFIERKVVSPRKKDRLIAFYKHQKFADCTFILDGVHVKAHKLILACSSPVFEKMLYGEMAQDEIVLCDINSNHFNQVLEYIYTDNINICSITDSWSLYYIANKYLLDDLAQVCLCYIRKNVTMSSLALSYEYAEMYDLCEIKKKCLDDMTSYTDGVFFTDYHMKSTTLYTILSRVSAGGERQFNLLSKTIKWCMVECEFRNIAASPMNIQDILIRENLIQFFQVNALEYSTCPECQHCMCECLDEVVKKTLKLLCEVLIWCKETSKKYTQKFIPGSCRIRKEFKIACRLDLSDKDEFFSSITSNRPMILFGLLVNTQTEPPRYCGKYYKGMFTLRICEYQSSRDVVKSTKMEEFVPYSSELYIGLKHLVVLEANRVYDLRISHRNCDLKGPSPLPCYYMGHKLTGPNKEDIICFYEPSGTIIKGLSVYPA